LEYWVRYLMFLSFSLIAFYCLSFLSLHHLIHRFDRSECGSYSKRLLGGCNPIHTGRAAFTTGSRTIFLCIVLSAPFFGFFISFFSHPQAVHVIACIALACPLRIIFAINSRRGRRSGRRYGPVGGCGIWTSSRRSSW